MEWISTKIRFPKAGEQVLTACNNSKKDVRWQISTVASL